MGEKKERGERYLEASTTKTRSSQVFSQPRSNSESLRPIFTFSAMTDRENGADAWIAFIDFIHHVRPRHFLSLGNALVLFSPTSLPSPDRSRLAKGMSRKKRSLTTRVQLLFTRLFVQRQTRSGSNYWIKRDPIAMETGSRMLLLDSSRGMRREEISTPPLSSFPTRPEERQERRQPLLLLLFSPPRGWSIVTRLTSRQARSRWWNFTMSFVYELPPSDTVKLDKIVLRIEGSRNTNEERTRDNAKKLERKNWSNWKFDKAAGYLLASRIALSSDRNVSSTCFFFFLFPPSISSFEDY